MLCGFSKILITPSTTAMEEAAAVSQSQPSYNHGDIPFPEPVREMIDCSQTGINPISIAATAPTQGLENVNGSTNESTAPTQTTTARVEPSIRKKSRAKVSMANKHLLGGKDLFVDSRYASRCEGPEDLSVVGKIVKCPNEQTNGSCFKVDWLMNLPGTVDPGCLKTWHHKETYTKALREAIQAHDKADGGQPNKQKRKRTPGTQVHPGTPPDQVRWRSRIGMRTVASASVSVQSVGGSSLEGGSTISSLSHSHNSQQNGASSSGNEGSCDRRHAPNARRETPDDNQMPPPPPRRTRQTTMTHPTVAVESDTDEGSDFDEEDNAHRCEDQPNSLSWGPDNESSSSDDDYEPRVSQRVPLLQLLEELKWEFSDVQACDPTVVDQECYECQGDSCLKPGVAVTFSDPFEAMMVSGLSYEFVARIAANSNDYCYQHIKPELGQNKFHQCVWTDITTEEMYRFFGVLLKMSLQPIDGGGYPAYFRTTNKELCTGYGSRAKKLVIDNTTGFASKIMTLRRFKQMRSAFHPEHVAAANSGDKCYQLRAALNQLNSSSLATFDPGKDLTFDEGGVACRSRLCPVRQHNKDKPDKCRVDFFILADSKKHSVLHVDVYQGKNPRDINVHPEAKGSPTTQKAVVNAVLQTRLHTETRAGFRHLSLDNRYQCPELAFLLRERCRLHSTGTCRKKRKGWNKSLMNLSKEENPTKAELNKGMIGGERGQHKLACDRINNVVLCQWRDSKVVNCVSTLMDTTVEQVTRTRGPVATFVECPHVLVKCQQTMFGVDKGGQMRLHGGGFARKAHFQTWYKRSFMATLDFMLLNSLIAWNMSVEEATDLHRAKFSRHDFYTWISEALLQCEDPARRHQREPLSPNVIRDSASRNSQKHLPGPAKKRSTCQVCRLEANVSNTKEAKALASRNCVACLDPACRIVAHNHVPAGSSFKIHELLGPGQTCFDLAHSAKGRMIWEPDARGLATVPHKVKTSHPMVQAVRAHCGLRPKKTRRPTDGTIVSNNNNNAT